MQEAKTNRNHTQRLNFPKWEAKNQINKLMFWYRGNGSSEKSKDRTNFTRFL